MKTQSFFQSKMFKILFPFVIILALIYIVKSGYHFGQWLYDVLN
jgi:hypothetical protein